MDLDIEMGDDVHAGDLETHEPIMTTNDDILVCFSPL